MLPETRSRTTQVATDNSASLLDTPHTYQEMLDLPAAVTTTSSVASLTPGNLPPLMEDLPSPSEPSPPLPQAEEALGLEDEEAVLDKQGKAFTKIIACTMGEAMAQALNATQSTNQLESTKYLKAKDPRMFNGKQHRYLQMWIGKNKICFCTAPNLYCTEVSKVMFAGSFLEGDAKTWFTEYFRDPTNIPAFMSDWTLFIIELQRNFGLEDKLGAAEEDLQNLSMQDKDHATYFIARFRTIISTLDGTWDDRNLRNMYYKKITSCLQAQFISSSTPVPMTLEPLITLVDCFDHAYWANFEMVRPQQQPGTATEKNAPLSPMGRSITKPVGLRSTPATATNPVPVTRPPISKATIAPHLTADGKLTAEEQQRCFDKGACLYCGEMGHIANQCAKKVATRARASTVETL
jgi:hypothetical protein